jgi:hypothetical protein
VAAGTDDGSIPDSSGLLRRIHPQQVIDDANTGKKRPSSAAFKDPDLSVDSEFILEQDGLDWHFSLKDHSAHSLVRFPASAARNNLLHVVHDPTLDNRAHTVVVGKKSPGVANMLRNASNWVFLAPTRL